MGEAIAQPPVGRTATAASSIDGFEDLYRQTFRRLYAYVASLLRDPSAAEEVTAQAYERAYRKRVSFRAGRGSAEAWLFAIARNAALDELRGRRRRATLETDVESRGALGRRSSPRTRSAARWCGGRSPCSSRASATWWRSSLRAASRT